MLLLYYSFLRYFAITVVTESNFVSFADKSEIPEQIRVVNIKWSLDEIAVESLDMPEVVIIPDEDMTDDEYTISDWLSDEYLKYLAKYCT